jgi:hypothetical protein
VGLALEIDQRAVRTPVGQHLHLVASDLSVLNGFGSNNRYPRVSALKPSGLTAACEFAQRERRRRWSSFPHQHVSCRAGEIHGRTYLFDVDTNKNRLLLSSGVWLPGTLS